MTFQLFADGARQITTSGDVGVGEKLGSIFAALLCLLAMLQPAFKAESISVFSVLASSLTLLREVHLQLDGGVG